MVVTSSGVSRPGPPQGHEARAAADRARRGTAFAWFTLTAMMLAGLAPALLLFSTPLSAASSPEWPWALAVAIAAALRYSWVVGAGQRRLFELIFWLFTYVFFGLAPLVQLRSGVLPGTTPVIDRAYNLQAFGVVAVGTTAFGIGLLVAGRNNHPGRAARFVVTHRVHLLTTVAVLLSSYYVWRVGIGTMFESRGSRGAVDRAAWPNPTILAVVKAGSTLPLVTAFAALMELRRQRRDAGDLRRTWLPWLVLALLVVVVNPISTPRYVAGTAVLAVLTAVGIASTPRRFRRFAVVLAASLVLVFPYAAFGRTVDTDVTANRAGPVQTLASSDFDAFYQINNTLNYVDHKGLTEGRQLAGAAFFFVPRNVWPEKAQDTGTLLADFRGYRVPNLSSPLVSEFFIDGGWVLLAVGMGSLGFLLRRLDESSLLLARRTGQQGVLAAITPFYMVIILRGSLLQAMAGLTVLVLSGLFVTARHPLPEAD